METESRMVVAKGWKEGKMGSYCLVCTVSFCNMKIVQETEMG
jgi:hypothetical protein